MPATPPRRPSRLRTTTFCLLLGLAATGVLAHGDVTPHPVDTSRLKQLGADWLDANPFRNDKQAIEIGAEGYLHNCAGCHGLNAVSGGMAPDLLKLDQDCLHMPNQRKAAGCMQDIDQYFKDIVLAGKKNGEGRVIMPAYSSVFTQEAVWAIKSYIDARTLESQ